MDIGGRFVGYFFAATSVLMFVLAGHLYRANAQFGESGVTAPGTVVDFKKFSQARRGRGNFDRYESPVIQFTSSAGQLVTFVAPRGSYEEGLNRGDTIEIIYLPSNPQGAEIRESTRLTFGTIAAATLGCAGLVPGVFLNLIPALARRRRKAKLARDVRRKSLIEAEVIEVKQLRQSKSGGGFTLQVVARWRDPSSGKSYRYESKVMRLDPVMYAKVKNWPVGKLPSREELGKQLLGTRLRVRIHPGDPEHYEAELLRVPGIGLMSGV